MNRREYLLHIEFPRARPEITKSRPHSAKNELLGCLAEGFRTGLQSFFDERIVNRDRHSESCTSAK